MSTSLPRDWAGFRWETSYAKLAAALYRAQNPTAVRAPQLVILNHRLAEDLGLDPSALGSEPGIALLAGNLAIEGQHPIAQAYAGHQFGHFNTLGDGRAILLGEHRTPAGRLVDIQWKGPGQTPFSRRGDGRLALGPALREFLISEAMVGLGVPTTRSLAVVATGEPVYREVVLPGAVLTRVASSHVRVGTFQFAAVDSDPEVLKGLVDYCVARHYPEIGVAGLSAYEKVACFFESVMDRQAALVASWLSVGFVHGVMNTDNMTISGETIDFGPCAFLDRYDPSTVFSSIDRHGRYAFGQQPGIVGWNLARLGETLVPLLGESPDRGVTIAQALLEKYPDKFAQNFNRIFGAKLGLGQLNTDDSILVQELLTIAAREQMDFSQTWLGLTDIGPNPEAMPASLAIWAKSWLARLKQEGTSAEQAVARMRKVNPIVIPRNHRVEQALAQATEGDLSAFERLLGAVRQPFFDSVLTRDLGAPPAAADPAYRTFCGT